jgi:hypothetical protein
MIETYLWHLWPGRHWPASPKEEKAFVAELTKRTDAPAETFERGDITAVLNILRLGLSLDEVLVVAPGLNLARLLGGYNYIARRRKTAADSFTHIIKHHTMSEINQHAEAASLLVPVPTYRVVTAIRNYEESGRRPSDARLMNDTLKRVKDLVAVAVTDATSAGDKLSTMTSRGATDEQLTKAVRLGRTLYDPYDDCLWGAQFYLPTRVTDLVPGRVSDLLEESEQ